MSHGGDRLCWGQLAAGLQKKDTWGGAEGPQTKLLVEAYHRQDLQEEEKGVWFLVVWADVT